MTPVRLEPAAHRSQVKHSTTEPLRSLNRSIIKRYYIGPYNHNVCITFFFKILCIFFKTVWTQISWLLMKPADQDPHFVYPQDESILMELHHLTGLKLAWIYTVFIKGYNIKKIYVHRALTYSG